MNYKVISVLMIALSACSSPYQQDMGATTLSPVEKSDKVTLSTLPSRTNLLPGAEKVVVQSLQDLNNAENCSKVLDMELKARTSYQRALNETKNRALLSGANAMAITSWSELPKSMIMKASLYNCNTKKM